jgi:hypothetical protein
MAPQRKADPLGPGRTVIQREDKRDKGVIRAKMKARKETKLWGGWKRVAEGGSKAEGEKIEQRKSKCYLQGKSSFGFSF